MELPSQCAWPARAQEVAAADPCLSRARHRRRFPSVYLFKFYNMRNEKFKELRDELKESSRCAAAAGSAGRRRHGRRPPARPWQAASSPPAAAAPPTSPPARPAHRFVMGSNKVLQVALGKTASDEYRTGLSALSERLKGNVGLLFTQLPQDEVRGPGAARSARPGAGHAPADARRWLWRRCRRRARASAPSTQHPPSTRPPSAQRPPNARAPLLPAQVEGALSSFDHEDYARAGSRATQDFSLQVRRRRRGWRARLVVAGVLVVVGVLACWWQQRRRRRRLFRSRANAAARAQGAAAAAPCGTAAPAATHPPSTHT